MFSWNPPLDSIFRFSVSLLMPSSLAAAGVGFHCIGIQSRTLIALRQVATCQLRASQRILRPSQSCKRRRRPSSSGVMPLQKFDRLRRPMGIRCGYRPVHEDTSGVPHPLGQKGGQQLASKHYMRRQEPACSQGSTTNGELPPQEPIGLHAEIRLKGQTHRRETVAEISMEPRRLELLTPCMPCSLFDR